MKKNAIKVITIPVLFIYELAIVNFVGWYRVLRRFAVWFLEILKRVGPFQASFILLSFSLLVLALLPWVTYNITFVEKETISVGSKFRSFFALPGLFGLLFIMIDIPYRKLIFLVLSGLILFLYLLGLVIPNPIHTSIIHSNEYRFLPYLFVYGLVLLSAAGVSRKALDNPIFHIYRRLSEDL